MLILIETMTINSSTPLDVSLGDLLPVRTIIYTLVIAHSLCWFLVQSSALLQSNLISLSPRQL